MQIENNKKTFIHGSGWFLAFVFFFWMFWGEGRDTTYLAATITIICSLIFYAHQYLIKLISKGKWVWYLTGLVLLLVLGPFLLIMGMNRFSPDFPSYYFLPFFLLTMVFIILSWLYRSIEIWVLNTIKRKELEKQNVSSELAYLKSQINPHFLFNTLNNIHTLAYKQSPQTSDAIMRLSSMMRYMIYESNAEKVSLGREVEYLNDYIGLQQLRNQNPDFIDFQVAGKVDTVKVAPLLLIPLLENAFKHSTSEKGNEPIRIRLTAENNELEFFISNPVAKIRKDKIADEGGIGLENLKKRLQLLYPGQHKLEVISGTELFQVKLTIRNLL